MLRSLAIVTISGCSFLGVRGPTSKGSNCTSDVTLPVVDTAIAVAGMASSLVFLARSSCDEELGDCTGEAIGKVLVGISAVGYVVMYGSSAAYGYAKTSQCQDYKRCLPQEQAARDVRMKNRDDAWALTKTAGEAARSGGCDRVRALEDEVRELDPAFHAAVFARDAAIMRCLTVASPTAAEQPAPAVLPTAAP